MAPNYLMLRVRTLQDFTFYTLCLTALSSLVIWVLTILVREGFYCHAISFCGIVKFILDDRPSAFFMQQKQSRRYLHSSEEYINIIFINNFIKPGAGGVLVGDRDVLLTRL